MKVQGMRRAIAGVIGASVMVISAIVVVPAADAQGRPNTASGDVSIAGARSSQTFWTRRRMAAATPLDSVPVRNRAAARGRPETETHRVVPTLIRPTAGRHAPKAGAALRTSTVSARARAVPRPYTNVPDRLNGKVFFTIGGSPFVCSGTVVNSRNRDMVDTAGHCVSDGAGNFYENWVFVPAYSSAETGCKSDAGCYPFGIWPARRLMVSTQWHRFANFREDLGYALLATQHGRHIVDVVGGQGSAFNLPRRLRWVDFGYSQEPPFDGFNQDFCLTRWISDDAPTDGPGPLAIGVGCNLTGGSSGGGWIVARGHHTRLGFVNGHNSYRYSDEAQADQHLYGPYYGAAALSLFRYSETQ